MYIYSSDFQQSFRECNECAFAIVWEELKKGIYPQYVEDSEVASRISSPQQRSRGKQQADYPVFAKVIPSVKQLVPSILGGIENDANKYVVAFNELAIVSSFCGEIFGTLDNGADGITQLLKELS